MKSTSSAKTAAQKEEEDLAKAIALSIKESTSSQSINKQSTSTSSNSKLKQETATSSLYGSINLNNRESERKKVKALYDFEAVEDNEITFKAGDILFVTDSSDQNWWKGIDQNQVGGLFPSNFVTSDLDYEEEELGTNGNSKKVSFNENANIEILDKEPQAKVQILIDEKKIDDCIELLQNADPTGEIQPDTQEMLQLEDQCYMMGPLIDQQLQKIDYKHAILEDLNMKILEAYQMYNTLMKESIIKTHGGFSATTNNFNPNMIQQQQSQQNMNQGFIPFVAAPPQTDANPHNLANQLNNFANYNNGMTSNDGQQGGMNMQPQQQEQYNSGFQNYPANMYQQYGGQMPAQVVDNNAGQNMMGAQMNTYVPDMSNSQAGQQYSAMPNQ